MRALNDPRCFLCIGNFYVNLSMSKMFFPSTNIKKAHDGSDVRRQQRLLYMCVCVLGVYYDGVTQQTDGRAKVYIFSYIYFRSVS